MWIDIQVMTQYYIISFALHYNLTQSLQEEEENRVKGESGRAQLGLLKVQN